MSKVGADRLQAIFDDLSDGMPICVNLDLDLRTGVLTWGCVLCAARGARTTPIHFDGACAEGNSYPGCAKGK